MKKLISAVSVMLLSVIGYAQTPEIGHFEQLKTVRRGDTIDVAWYYKPASGVDVRTFQVDFQFKKTLFTHISTTVDVGYTSNSPTINFQKWDNYKYSSYSSGTGTYSYTSDTNWSIGRNYLIFALGSSSAFSSNGYIIHNKFIINNVDPNYVSDSITVNWSRMFKVDGTTIGDNVATLSHQKQVIKLLGNLTISGKIWFPSTMTTGLLPTIYCYEKNTGVLVSQTVPSISGNYTLTNIDENTKYKIEVKFPQDSLTYIRDNAVTISDAIKAYNEYVNTDVNQNYGKTFLKHGLGLLIGDINLNTKFDGGDPYGIYASVSGLKPIDTAKLINVFSRNEYDSLVLGSNQWVDWVTYSDRGKYIYDSVGTTNLTLDIKYFILGDVDRTHSSPVFLGTTEVFAAIYKGQYNVEIPDVYSVGQPMYVPFNINTNGDKNNGLQFEVKYDVNKVNFDEIVSNLQGPWLQYVTHDNVKGIVRFGAMNNQKKGSLQGIVTPFKLKFSAKVVTDDIKTDVVVRKLMDASDKEGDHFNIVLASQRVVMMYKRAQTTNIITEPTAILYPNPNKGEFKIDLELLPNTTMNASIYDYQGKLMINLGDVESVGNVTKITKTVTQPELPQGEYMLVLSGYNKKITKPFIKL
jgi:hypothetical protein